MVEEAVSEAVIVVADQEFRRMEAGELEPLLELLADDVLFLPPNDAPKSGEAVAPWLGEFLRGFRVRFLDQRHDEILAHGDWAVLRTSFRWRVAPRAGGDALARCGTTVRTFRREADGAWRLAREIWNTYDSPPT